MWNRLRSYNFNKSLYAVFIEAFLARLGFGIITFALPFFALSLGMSYTEVGILAALRLLTAIAFKPLMGAVSNRYGKRRVYLWSAVGRAIVGVMLVFATAPWMLFAIRVFHGVTTAARDPVSAFLIVEHGDRARMASAFAWYGTFREVGAVAGYLIAGILLTLSDDNYHLVFSLPVITSLFACSLIIMFVQEHREQSDSPNSTPVDQPEMHWLELALLGIMMALTGSMINNLFPLIATEFAHLSKAETSIIYALATVAIVVLGPLFGWVSDHVSQRAVLSIRSICNAISSIIYPLFPGFTGVTLARITDESGKAAFRPAWGSMIAQQAQVADAQQQGRRIAYLDTAHSMGEALGPALAGLLWDQLGIFWLFAMRFMLAILCELYYFWLIRKHLSQAALKQRLAK